MINITKTATTEIKYAYKKSLVNVDLNWLAVTNANGIESLRQRICVGIIKKDVSRRSSVAMVRRRLSSRRKVYVLVLRGLKVSRAITIKS